MTFLLGYNLEILFSRGRGIDFWWGSLLGEFFQVEGGDEQIFGFWGGDFSPSPQQVKP